MKWEAAASGTVSRVEFFLDNASAPVWTEREAPYVFNGDAGLLDTTKLADGAHVLGLKAVASDGTTGEAKLTVNVANAVPTTTPPAAPVLESTPAKETTETSASFAFSTSYRRRATRVCARRRRARRVRQPEVLLGPDRRASHVLRASRRGRCCLSRGDVFLDDQ